MSFAPILWFLVSLVLTFRRPGFLLACVFTAYVYENFYGVSGLGEALFLIFMVFTIMIFVLRGSSTPIFNLEMLLALFAALYVLSILYAPHTGFALYKAVYFLGQCIGYYVIGRVLCTDPGYSERLVTDFGISIVLLMAMFGYLGVTGDDFYSSTTRLALGGKPVGFSQTVDIALAFSLYYFLFSPAKDGWIKKSAALGAFGLLSYIALLNATRGTITSLVLGLIAFVGILVVTRSGSGVQLRVLMSLGFLVLASAVIVVHFLVGVTDGQLAYAIGRLTQNLGQRGYELDASSAIRLRMFGAAWELFLSAPILGHGTGSYYPLTSLAYPHNMFLQLLSENGAIMTMLFGVILAGYLSLGVKLLKATSFSIAPSIAMGWFLVSFAHHQVSFSFEGAKPMFLAMGIIAGLYGRTRSPSELVGQLGVTEQERVSGSS